MKSEYSKITVKKPVNELAKQVAAADNRPSVANLVEHLVKKEAKRFKIGTRLVTKPRIPTAPTLPENINTNQVKNDKANNVAG